MIYELVLDQLNIVSDIVTQVGNKVPIVVSAKYFIIPIDQD